jgi:hypothetical protein
VFGRVNHNPRQTQDYEEHPGEAAEHLRTTAYDGDASSTQAPHKPPKLTYTDAVSDGMLRGSSEGGMLPGMGGLHAANYTFNATS